MKDEYIRALNIFKKHSDPDEVNRVMRKGDNCVNYAHDFYGFLEQYLHLSKIIPKDWYIIDFGCAAAFQSVFFKKHRLYVGVDHSFSLNARYQTRNSFYFNCSIEKFIDKKLYEKLENLDLKKTFAICNYVPSEKAKQMIREAFPNLFVYYPA